MDKVLTSDNKLIIDDSNKILTVSNNSININGLIEEYKVFAGENINAGDFVEFINTIDKTPYDDSGHSFSISDGYKHVFLLEPNKVFILTSNQYGITIIFDGTNTTTTYKQITMLSRSTYYKYTSGVVLANNKIFLAHSDFDDRFCGMLIEISDTDITATCKVLIDIEDILYTNSDCILLEENKIFVAHGKTMNGQYLCGTIVTINGTEMTAVTSVLSSESYSCNGKPSCILLEPNKVFIASPFNWSKQYLYGTIVTINGTEMTAVSTTLNETEYSCRGFPKCILLEPNKLLIVHPYSTYYLYGTIVTINGYMMTAKTIKLFNEKYYCTTNPSIVKINDNELYIIHTCFQNKHHVYLTKINIYGTRIFIKKPEVLVDKYYKCTHYYPIALLVANKLFITTDIVLKDGYSPYVHCILYVEEHVKSASETIHGIAKTSGTEGQTIQVYVPNKE